MKLTKKEIDTLDCVVGNWMTRCQDIIHGEGHCKDDKRNAQSEFKTLESISKKLQG